MEFHEMLRKMVIEKASDLFVKVGSPPSLRIDGTINFLDTDEVTPQDTLEMFEIIEDSKKDGFRGAQHEVDVAYELPGIGRHVMDLAVGDEHGAGETLGRHFGERLVEGGEETGAVLARRDA